MRKLLFLLSFVILFGSAEAQRRFAHRGKTFTVPDQYFSGVSTSQSGNVITNSFTTLITNQNQPPSIERVTVTGTAMRGQTLTANLENFFSPGAYSAGTHTYQWYRADNYQSSGAAISAATNSTYVLQAADVAKYIRVEITPVQSGGMNTAGTAVTSIYTDQIEDNVWNPLTDVSWFTAHTPAGATDLPGSGWLNYGDQGGVASVQNASDAIPTYSSSDGGYVDFEASNNEELVLDLPNPQFSMPVEIWIRVKFESYNGSFSYPIAWNGSQRLEQRASGAIYLSGASTGYTIPLNTWVVMRFVVSGSASTSEFNYNNQTEITNINASTTAFGTSNGRLGSNSGGTGNRFDGQISHIFVKSGELSSGDQTEMWNWFNTNAPWDFTPELLDNKVYWLDADNVTLGSGTEVTGITNLFGGSGATTVSARNTPNQVTDGGGQALQFTRANNEILRAPAVTGITNYTMYVVFKANGTSSTQKVIGNGGTATTTSGWDANINSNQFQISNRNATSPGQKTFAFTETSNYHILTIKWQSIGATTSNFLSRTVFKIDNASQLTDGDARILASCSSGFDIGSDGSNNSLDGYIKSILIYSDWHSKDEEQDVYGYLNNKWGLAVTTTMPDVTFPGTIQSGDAATATLGTASLYGDIFEYPDGDGPFPTMILMHGYTDVSSNLGSDAFTRFANAGFFVIAPQMRGRVGTGTRDSGGQEPYDIYDVYQNALTRFTGLNIISTTRVALSGYSGGGGNAMSFATRFPDLCPVVCAHFGMSDYGYDNTFSWYIEEVSRQTQLDTDVGSPRSSFLNEYFVRNSVDAIAKNYKGQFFIFHDDLDTSVDLDQSSRVKDAYTAEGRTVTTSKYGGPVSGTEMLYSVTTSGDSPRWLHANPTSGAGIISAESQWVPNALSGTIPTMPNSGTIYVRGWVRTKDFQVMLGNGTTASNGKVRSATLVYNISSNSYTVTPDLKSGASDETVTVNVYTGAHAGQSDSGTISTATTFTPH